MSGMRKLFDTLLKSFKCRILQSHIEFVILLRVYSAALISMTLSRERTRHICCDDTLETCERMLDDYEKDVLRSYYESFVNKHQLTVLWTRTERLIQSLSTYSFMRFYA